MKLIFSTLLLSFLTLFTACEKEMSLDLNTQSPKLIVEGNILLGLDTIITTQTIKLSETANFTGKNKPKAVENALVTVEDGANVYTFSHTIDGIYTSSFKVNISKIYTLKISYKNRKYQATASVNKGPIMDSLGIKFFPSALGSPEGNFVVINTTDPINQKNYYLWQLYINEQLMINPSPGNIYRAIQKDEFFNGQALKNYLPFDNFNVKKEDKIVMQQLSISEAQYNYFYSIFNLTATSPVSGDVPPANIKGNIINLNNKAENALGYFGACSVSIKTMVVK
jgi:Domain of unknown function (DUF4249)